MQACLNIVHIPNINSLELKVNKDNEAWSHLPLCLLLPM